MPPQAKRARVGEGEFAVGVGDVSVGNGGGDVLQQAKEAMVELRRLAEENENAIMFKEKGGPSLEAVVEETVALLTRLKELPVDVAVLRRTRIGNEANDDWIRKHPDQAVRTAGKALVKTWKAAANVELAATAASSTAVPAPSASAATSLPHAAINDRKTMKHGRSKSGIYGPNRDLAELFLEMARFEFQQKRTFRGIPYTMIAKTLGEIRSRITSVSQVKGKKGFGPEILANIKQYLETGTFDRLQRYRAGDFRIGKN